MGRRSLLWHKESQGEDRLGLPFILTSVGYSAVRTDLLPLDEVPADGIYCLSIGGENKALSHYPWIPSTTVADDVSQDPTPGMVRLVNGTEHYARNVGSKPLDTQDQSIIPLLATAIWKGQRHSPDTRPAS